MSRRYLVKGAANTGSSVTIINLFSVGTSTQPRVEQFSISTNATTPAENNSVYQFNRTTAVGTEGSGFTPVAIDPDAADTSADSGIGTFSVEPTYTASAVLFEIAVHMRATYTWNAKPGMELVCANAANNGIGCRTLSSTTPYSALVNMIFTD